jgi:hypothetical protein
MAFAIVAGTVHCTEQWILGSTHCNSVPTEEAILYYSLLPSSDVMTQAQLCAPMIT